MVSPGGDLFYCKNVKSTGKHCSLLHTNSVFTLTVGDGALDVPLV